MYVKCIECHSGQPSVMSTIHLQLVRGNMVMCCGVRFAVLMCNQLIIIQTISHERSRVSTMFVNELVH